MICNIIYKRKKDNFKWVRLTEDNRLSAKTLITRDFITSMHRIMPIILKKHGLNIDEYEETEEKKQGGLSAKEYNELAERYNKRIDDKAE